jgi:hypothetical protein
MNASCTQYMTAKIKKGLRLSRDAIGHPPFLDANC